MNAGQSGSERLQGAGAGSAVGGICLAVFSAVVSFPVASALVVALAVSGWAATRSRDVSTQLFVGIAAIGVLGLLESMTTIGVGVTAGQLALFAIILGLTDVLVGTVVERLRRRSG